MELNEFVNKSLRAIIDGVAEAQSYAKEKGAKINPTYLNSEKAKYWSPDGPFGQDIEFDVAVMANESTEGKINAGISVWGIGAGGEKSKEFASSTSSRIKFSIIVVLPPQT